MQEVSLRITNPLGLHARSSAKLVNMASKFESHIEIIYGDHVANAKSILDIMLLAVSYNAIITLKTEGPDEHEALEALTTLIQQGFGE